MFPSVDIIHTHGALAAQGYGGDGHTSMETAMATYDSGAFFNRWAGDWADVQVSDFRKRFSTAYFVVTCGTGLERAGWAARV